MARLGVDFSFARLSAAELKAAGYTFAARYLASSAAKRISANEVADFKVNILDLVLVWEDEANAALNGFNQGQHDATKALDQANGIGWPTNLPIYFAVDFDATEADQVAINGYFDGVNSVIGLGRSGVYGGYYVVKRTLDAGKASFSWQAVAWSGGQVDPRVNIYQNGQSAFNGQADVNEARQTNFGQWSMGEQEMTIQKGDVDAIWSTFLGTQPAQTDYDYAIGKTWDEYIKAVTTRPELRPQRDDVNTLWAKLLPMTPTPTQVDYDYALTRTWRNYIYDIITRPDCASIVAATITPPPVVPPSVLPATVTPHLSFLQRLWKILWG